MCGIIGYNGKGNVKGILIDGLKALEYRGYDSAGIALSSINDKEIIKSVGRVAKLEEKVKNESKLTPKFGIAHTRWATNGAATLNNAHPHTNGKVTLVHNGIIENSDVLKNDLIKKGVKFYGDTDSEVVAALINYYLDDNDIVDSINKALKMLKGSYALVIMIDGDNNLYAVRKDSPLIIGYSDNGYYAVSDISATLGNAKKIVYLDVNVIAKFNSDTITYYRDCKEIKEKVIDVSNISFESSKDGYEHFMLKEIMEEPKLVSNFINKYLYSDNSFYDISNYKRIDIVACGSAMHAGLTSKYLIEKYDKIEVNVHMASEYRYEDKIYLDKDKTLIILISQSGETADTIAALREAKENGIKTLGIVNREGSTIAREADYVIMTEAGVETAVATTKAYIMQVLVLSLIAIKTSIKLGFSDKNLLDEFKKLPHLIEAVLNNSDNIKSIASKIYNIDNCFFIGRLIDYAMCMEASLKLKEVSYIHSECYAAGELKHGTISLIEKGTTVFAIITDKSVLDKTISNLKETLARGARGIVITCDDTDTDFDLEIKVPNAPYFIEPMVLIPSLQLLSYYVAKERGCDIDKPRNLAKSVTVE